MFYLMTEKGLEVLRSIVRFDKTNQIAFVVIGEDKNLVQDYSEEIKHLCLQYNIPFDVASNKPAIPKSTYAVAISWRWLIPLTETKLIVIHDSLLPKLRGFAPLVTALMKRETEIGATAIFGVEQFDRGPIIAQISRSIEYPIKIETAIKIIAEIYVELVQQILEKVSENHTLSALPQNEDSATYSVWRDDEDYLIDWKNSAEEIQTKVNATGFPYKGAASYVKSDLVRIYDVSIVPDLNIENRDCGKVLFISDHKPVVICGKGLLRIETICFDHGSEFLPLKNFRVKFKSYASAVN